MPGDLALLERYVATCDADALAAIIERHQGLVYGTCMRILGNAADAEDAAQECFIRLFRHAAGIRFSLAGWLHCCATRISLNARKKANVRRGYERRYRPAEAPDDPAGPSWHEIAPHLDRALAELPPKYLHVLVERYLRRRGGTEIARELNISRVTLYRRLDEGIRMLRAKLQAAGALVAVGILEVLLEEHAAAAAPPALAERLARLAADGPPLASEAAHAPPRPAARPGAGPIAGIAGGILLTLAILVGVAYEVGSETGLAGLLGLRPAAVARPVRPGGQRTVATRQAATPGALAAAIAGIVEPSAPKQLPAAAPPSAPADRLQRSKNPPTRGPAEEDDGPWLPFWITSDVPAPRSRGPAAGRPAAKAAVTTTAPAKANKPAPYPFAPADVVTRRREAINLVRRAEEARRRSPARPRRRTRRPYGINLSVHRGKVEGGRVISRGGAKVSPYQPIVVNSPYRR